MSEILKIILLENDATDIELVKILLEENLPEYSFDFQSTESKPEFIDLIKSFKPDLVLSDFMLPQYNGFEAIKDLKNIDVSIPIIIVTGSLSEEDAADSIKIGATDYVVKQRIERLPVAIRNAINLKRELEKTKAKELEITLLKEKTGLQIKTCFHTIEKAPVVIFITNEKGIIEYVNAKFIEITGYSFEESVGKNPSMLKSGHQAKSIYYEMWETILAGYEWKGEFINKRKNGELYWADVSISSIQDETGKLAHFIAIQNDITIQKQQKIELQQAKERAEENDKLKTLFLSNLSHEIRTPMNGILGFSDLLKDPILTLQERLHYVSIIEQSGQRMLALINDIVDISKIEAGQVTISYEKFDVSLLGKDLFDFFKLEAQKKSIELTYLPQLEHCVIESDLNKINQILSNLIRNAIKFTEKGNIEFGFTLQQNQLTFFIHDTGIGIHPELQGVIFERFRQANISAYKAEEGIGLGLSICKSFVEMLGGTIWVDSELDKGSTFYFTIPLTEILTESNIIDTNNQVTIKDGITILIAEDDLANFILLEKILKEAANVTILHAQNGADAIHIFKIESKIDIILTDIKMPQIDGIETIRVIKALNPLVPIIVQTAFATSLVKQKVIEAGANKIITKPINKYILLKSISDLL